MNKTSGLGKGLSSLIPDETLNSLKQAYIPDLPIDRVTPNSYQPRVEIDPEKLVELADSLREHGVIEPLIVTQRSSKEFELIAGERRWRAAKLAGMTTIPVVVKDASPQQMLELAIVENIQREDLNPLEEAMAFEHLYTDFGLNHEDIAKKVGYSRPAIANKIRLLQLPDTIKKGLIENKVSEGHARALLGLDNHQTMEAAYNVVVRDGLSVRATEKLVQRLKLSKKKPTHDPNPLKLNAKLLKLEKDLQISFKTQVKVNYANGEGKITIPFKNDREFEKIVEKLNINIIE